MDFLGGSFCGASCQEVLASRLDLGIPWNYNSFSDYRIQYPWKNWVLWRVDSRALYPTGFPVLPKLHQIWLWQSHLQLVAIDDLAILLTVASYCSYGAPGTSSRIQMYSARGLIPIQGAAISSRAKEVRFPLRVIAVFFIVGLLKYSTEHGEGDFSLLNGGDVSLYERKRAFSGLAERKSCHSCEPAEMFWSAGICLGI